ncbi:TPA: BppU family phage baseplate upper protein [Bacillus luti]
MTFKTRELTVDLVNEISTNEIRFSQGDENSAKLVLNITNQGQELDLTKATAVRITFEKSDGKTVFQQDCQVINAMKGKYQIVLNTQTLAVVGNVYGQVQIIEGGQKIDSQLFVFTVKRSLSSNDAVESTNEFTIIQRALEVGDQFKDVDFAPIIKAGETAEKALVEVNKNKDQIGILSESVGNNTTQLGNKADKTYVDSELTKKVSQSDLTVKADKTYVDTKVSAVASGSPKGTYATLADLQTAKPTGDSNIYVVTADGKWYYWSGASWTAGGTYQSTGIADGTVTKDKVAANAVDFTKLNVTFLRGELIAGTINVDTAAKTITSTGVTMTTNTSNRNIANQTLNYTGTVVNLFYNLSSNAMEVYTAGDLTPVATSHNHLVLLATIYTNKLYNMVSRNGWSLNGTPLYIPVFSNQNVLFMGGTSYGGYGGILDVQFDEVNKTITFPKNGCIVQGSKMYILSEDKVIPLTGTLTIRTLILFNTLTSEIYLKTVSGSGHIPAQNDLMLGSFLYEYTGGNVSLKNIQGCFPYSVIKRITPTTAIPSVWNGKKANFAGDSITAGSYGNYLNTVQSILGLSTVRNYGVGGSRLCEFDDENNTLYPPLINRWEAMDNDADIIFILIGTNDASAGVPIGNDDSTNKKEFKGALNIMLGGLRDKYPDKLIIISNQLHRFNDNTVKLNDYRDATKVMCQKYKMVMYDAFANTGFDFAKGYYDKILTDDGLHPNAKGAAILGRKIAGFINIQ